MNTLRNVKTRNDFADFLNIPRKQLSYVLYVKKVENLYITFKIPKKNGGIREIHAPLAELKDIQKKLADTLYEYKEKKNNISHAFEKQKNIITNAKIHRNKKFVLNIDLEDFFESFHFGRVRGFFNKNKNFLFSIEIATIIAQIVCYNGKLPQGAPSSPIITNLICEILDFRIMKITKKYKLHYTRYADDLTFSTNDMNFLRLYKEFYNDITKEIEQFGFKINEKKTRLQYQDSRQVVTGLVVNKKINVNRVYYKETRAMAHQLYKYGNFKINGEDANINQLEGRLSFINQLTWYNKKINNSKVHYSNLSAREREYQKFLVYKYFFANPKPLIVVEGKTDVIYLKAALKSLYQCYPNLVSRNNDGTFDYKISFLNKTKRLAYFFGISQDGGSGLRSIYDFFNSEKKNLNYVGYFKKISNNSPRNPVILIFDNEIKSKKDKPINVFLNYIKANNNKKILEAEYKINITDNLYLLTIPLVDGRDECDIEDLFDKDLLCQKIDGKKFTKKDKYDISKYYGKSMFSKRILNNYVNINFERFKPLLDNINGIVEKYNQ